MLGTSHWQSTVGQWAVLRGSALTLGLAGLLKSNDSELLLIRVDFSPKRRIGGPIFRFLGVLESLIYNEFGDFLKPH